MELRIPLWVAETASGQSRQLDQRLPLWSRTSAATEKRSHRQTPGKLGRALVGEFLIMRSSRQIRHILHTAALTSNDVLNEGHGNMAAARFCHTLSGWRHRKPLKRAKSPSVVINSQPCSMASAAK